MKKLPLPFFIVIFAAAAFFARAAIYEPYAISTVAGWGDNTHTVDGPRHTAEFATPDGLAIDQNGNVYVTEFVGHVVRKITPRGVASTFAGKAGEPGIADGTGGEARFNGPRGLAIAPDGMIYVADHNNQTVRKITPDAVVTTFAGHPGVSGFRDGVGLGARFNEPAGVTVTEAGDLFVAEEINHAIRKITPDATVTTFSRFLAGFPEDIAADSDGNFYVATTASIGKLIKITPDGVWGYFGDYGAGWATGLVVDPNGNIFVANGKVIKVSPTGELSDFAGGTLGSADGTGLDAQFNGAKRIAIDSAGNFYISDEPNNTIRKMTPDAVVTTFCGVADVGSHDGIGAKARFAWPRGVVSDAAGTLYVADTGNDTVRKITPDGRVTTIAGKVQTPGYVDGRGAHARFASPWMITIDTTGNLYVVDQGNSVIRKITADLQVTTLANGYVFSTPSGIALDGTGNIFVSETNNQTIDKITPDGQVSIFAGSPGQGGRTDGTGSEARFNGPTGIACDSAGTIYVADMNNSSIRKITSAAVVTTLAGFGGHGSTDGDGSVAQFYHPTDVAVDTAGNLYVADNANSTLRKITPEAYVTTLAGRPGQIGWIDATGSDARFFSPYGVTVDGSGNVFVADVDGQTIRKGSPEP